MTSRQLGVSEQVVKNQFSKIFKKLRSGHEYFDRMKAKLTYFFYVQKGLPLPQDTMSSGLPPRVIIFNSPPDIRS